MGTELEWKFDLPERCGFDELLAWEGLRPWMTETPRRLEMRTTYYDSAERQLSARRITLRRRLENGVSVICVKAPLPGAADSRLRGEWELEAEAPKAALPALIALGAPAELAELGELFPVCGAAFTRLAVLLRFADGSAAELALDEGTLFGSRRSLPFRVLELEHKAGGCEAALAFCGLLQRRFGLTPQPLSKLARAKEL